MHRRASHLSKIVLVAACAMSFGSACFGQATPTTKDLPSSRADIYLGYGYFHPVNSDINNHPYQDIYNFPNGTLSVTGYLGRYLGVQVEGGYFDGSSPRGAFGQCRAGACSDRDPMVYTAEAGPILRLPLGRWVPYVHALGGGARINGPILQKLTWGWGVTGGVGVDYILPYFHNRFAIRPIQADFHYSQVDYGPLQLPAGLEGGFGEIYAVKLSGGIVARFGVPNETRRPVELGCTTQPGTVFPGEPVVANASTVNMDPRKHPYFLWTTSGGKLTQNDSSATIDTSGLTPGDYTVGGHMSYGKKASEQASCTAPFTVKAYEPPTITCTAMPATVVSGGTVSISTLGMSPQNRPLTYSYSASAGQITGAGATATVSTAGLGATTINVTCNLVDDMGKTASATTTISVESQPVPKTVQTQPLCSMSFERDRARPARVNNEAKGCLDDIALTMNQQSDAQLFIIGNASAGENAQTAAERALNIRQYLTREKGVDPARVYVRTGETSGRMANAVLVPAGAVFSELGTLPIDEGSVKHHGQPYGQARTIHPSNSHHHVRKSAAPATGAAPGPPQ